MASEYVDYEMFSLNFMDYHDKMINSTAKINEPPFVSSNRTGLKYIIELEPFGETTVNLTIWKQPPPWVQYQRTAPALIGLMEDENMSCMFKKGQEVYFEGYVIVKNGIVWINVEKVLVVSPDITIGVHEIVSRHVCERKYYLDYIKNAKDNTRKPWTPGRPADLHGMIIKAITYNFNGRGSPTERMPESAFSDTVKALINDRDVQSLFKNQIFYDSMRLPETYGIFGEADFLVGGRPVELKTYKINDEHIYQLKVYLTIYYLDNGVCQGHLLYSEPQNVNGSRVVPITITDDDIASIIYDRHRVLLLRNHWENADTYSKPCITCIYGGLDNPERQPEAYSACQFYCQTERHWKCYEVDETGHISRTCSLFDLCEYRDRYFDIALIDYFNRMRKAVDHELCVLKSLDDLFHQLKNCDLEKIGQRINGLKLQKYHEGLCSFSRDMVIPQLGITTGDYVKIKRKGSHPQTVSGILKKVEGSQIDVMIPGKIPTSFEIQGGSFVLFKDYGHNSGLRRLLRIMDLTQRTRRQIDMAIQKGKLKVNRSKNVYTSRNIALEISIRKIIGLNVPPQKYPVRFIMEIIANIERNKKVLLIFNDVNEIERALYDLSDRRTIVLSKVCKPSDMARVSVLGADVKLSDIDRIADSVIIITDYQSASYNRDVSNYIAHCKPGAFDIVIMTHAERVPEPIYYFFSVLGQHKLLVGDPGLLPYPLKSLEARSLGLNTSILEKLINNYEYFEPLDFNVFYQLFTDLPHSVLEAFVLAGINIAAEQTNGIVYFIDVPGVETAIDGVTYEKRTIIHGADIPLELELKLEQVVDIDEINAAIDSLCSIDIQKIKNDIIKLNGIIFQVVNLKYYSPDSTADELPEQSIVRVQLWPKNLEAMAELTYANPMEAESIVKILKTIPLQGSTVVITPFTAQASLIKELVHIAGIKVDIGIPNDFSGRRFDNVVISTVCANGEKLVRWPLHDRHTQYTMFTMAEKNLYIIGDRSTISHNMVLQSIIAHKDTRIIKVGCNE